MAVIAIFPKPSDDEFFDDDDEVLDPAEVMNKPEEEKAEAETAEEKEPEAETQE